MAPCQCKSFFVWLSVSNCRRYPIGATEYLSHSEAKKNVLFQYLPNILCQGLFNGYLSYLSWVKTKGLIFYGYILKSATELGRQDILHFNYLQLKGSIWNTSRKLSFCSKNLNSTCSKGAKWRGESWLHFIQ